MHAYGEAHSGGPLNSKIKRQQRWILGLMGTITVHNRGGEMSNPKERPQSEEGGDSTSADNMVASSRIANRELQPAEKATARSDVLNIDMASAAEPPITWEHVVENGSAGISDSNSRKILTVEKLTDLLHQHGIASLRWCTSIRRRREKHKAQNEDYRERNEDKDSDAYDREHNVGLNYILRLTASSGSANSETNCEIERIRKIISAERIVGTPAKRYVLGSEIALALIIAAAGATRIRGGTGKSGPRTQLIPGDRNSQDLNSGNENSQDRDAQDRNAGDLPAGDATAGEQYFLSGRSGDINTERNNSTAHPRGKKQSARPKTIIASTDTLISIAEAFFYDPNVAWLIADLNQKITKESFMDGKRIVEVKSRQQIELPLREEIERFYRTRSDNERGENVITIVDETVIDSELLNSSLMKLLNPEEE